MASVNGIYFMGKAAGTGIDGGARQLPYPACTLDNEIGKRVENFTACGHRDLDVQESNKTKIQDLNVESVL